MFKKTPCWLIIKLVLAFSTNDSMLMKAEVPVPVRSVYTFSVVAAAEDVRYVQFVGQQEECSQKLLHSHHALQEML